jgi:transposase-like protein
MAISFKGADFPKEVILMGVRWYLAYPLSTRHVEELMAERGVEVDHATINRWVIKYSPQMEEAFHRHKRQVWKVTSRTRSWPTIAPSTQSILARRAHHDSGCGHPAPGGD